MTNSKEALRELYVQAQARASFYRKILIKEGIIPPHISEKDLRKLYNDK